MAGRLGLGCGVLCRVRANLGFTLEASASGFRAVFSNPEVCLGMLSIETTPECHGIADIHTHTWLGCFRYFRASGREVEAVVTITIVVALIAVSAVGDGVQCTSSRYRSAKVCYSRERPPSD